MSVRLSRVSTSLALGSLVLIVVALGVLIVPLVSSYSSTRGSGESLAAPLTQGHLLGTDALSRDLATRLAVGARNSLAIATAGLLLALSIGVTVGLLAGFLGGRADAMLMRMADVQLAFPYLLLALTVAAAVKPTIPILIVLLALAAWVVFARTTRAAVRRELAMEYVQAATVLGASRLRIAMKYVLPNLLPVLAALTTLTLAALILVEATLGYLGIGIQPPTPSLGGMMQEGQTFLRSAWWLTVIPGSVLFIVALALNLVTEGLRGHLDPRLRGLR